MPVVTFGGRAGTTHSGVEDVALYSAFPNNNYSAGVDNGGDGYPILLRFPGIAATIPAGSTINDAVLTFNVQSGAIGARTLTWRKVLRAWVVAQATWNDWATSSVWTTAGAGSDGNDRAAATSATTSYPGGYDTGDYASTGNTQLIADVQAIVGGAQNNGWLMLTSGGLLEIRLSDHATASTRPQLTVDYTAGGSAVPVFMHHLTQQGIS